MPSVPSCVVALAAVLCSLGASGGEEFVDTPEVLRLAAVARGPGAEAERLSALRKLRELGPEASAAAPILIELTSDPRVDKRMRMDALSALAFMAPVYKTVIPALIGQFPLDDGYLPAQALAIIGRPAVKPLLAAAQSRMDDSARRHALEALGPIRDPAILRLLARLVAADKSYTVRNEAVRALGELREAAAPAVGVIATQLARGRITDKDALIALGRIGPKARKALPLVAGKLEARDETTRALAAFTLFSITGGEKGRGLFEKLLKGGQSLNTRGGLHEVLVVGPALAPAIPILLGILRDKGSLLRRPAVCALGEIGQGTPEVLDALRKVRATETGRGIVASATSALAVLGEVDDHWAYTMARQRYHHLIEGRQAHRQLVSAGKAVVADLVRMLDHPKRPPLCRWIAVRVLRDIGPDAAEALPSLEAQLAKRVPGRKYSWRDAIPEAVASIRGKSSRRRR